MGYSRPVTVKIYEIAERAKVTKRVGKENGPHEK